jgi:3-carboxy-cis,cis-muconate cycloisomerase
MTISPFDHPYLRRLLGDEEIAEQLSAQAEISAMLEFERALAEAQAEAGLIAVSASEAIVGVCATFAPVMDGLRTGTARDGVVVPELVKQLRKAVGGEAAEHVHWGATSQDAIDTGLMLRLKRVARHLVDGLGHIDETFQSLDERFGSRSLMAYTRMQPALPITVSDRIRAWREPLRRTAHLLQQHKFPLQFGGAVGTLDKMGDNAAAIRSSLAARLELADEPQWQNQRGVIVEFGNLLSQLTGSLGKFGQDVALLAEVGKEIQLTGGGGSSAMAHKQNPVAAEVLVALARFNAVQVGGLHQSLVHEQERSGSAWTLEWLILPPMTAAAGAALRLARVLGNDVRSLGVKP